MVCDSTGIEYSQSRVRAGDFATSRLSRDGDNPGEKYLRRLQGSSERTGRG